MRMDTHTQKHTQVQTADKWASLNVWSPSRALLAPDNLGFVVCIHSPHEPLIYLFFLHCHLKYSAISSLIFYTGIRKYCS